MRKILYLIISMPILLLSACDVHEWPETPEFVKLHLRLNYETDMTEWEHLYDGASVIEQGLGETYDNHQDYGKIRYIVRTYPVSEKQRTTSNYTQEFVFTKDIAEGYNHEVTLNVLPGNYNFMVWSDLVQTSGDSHFYNADNFAEITLQGDHKGNTDHRDSFRGSNNITLIADIMERLPDTLNVAMQRPLAKFEFITNDVVEFIDKESTRLASTANDNKNNTSAEAEKTASKDGNFNLTVNFASEPMTMDPALNSSVDGAVMANHLFEGLMKWESTGEEVEGSDGTCDSAKLTYGQAESYDKTANDDGTVTYTFHLRDGIKWSDGKEVTAGDFEYAWKRLVNPATAADYN